MDKVNSNEDLPGLEWEDDDDESTVDWFCPACGVEYDEIDLEYQICHLCRYNNNKNK